MKGFHYTRGDGPAIGAIITSEASTYTTYQFTWDIYARVAKELGIYFPEHFGYAYAEVHDVFKKSVCFHVEAPDEFVTTGNLNFSLMMAQDAYSPSAVRGYYPDIKSIAERQEKRAQMIENWAKKYFTMLDRSQDIELISDKWTVIKKG